MGKHMECKVEAKRTANPQSSSCTKSLPLPMRGCARGHRPRGPQYTTYKLPNSSTSVHATYLHPLSSNLLDPETHS